MLVVINQYHPMIIYNEPSSTSINHQPFSGPSSPPNSRIVSRLDAAPRNELDQGQDRGAQTGEMVFLRARRHRRGVGELAAQRAEAGAMAMR